MSIGDYVTGVACSRPLNASPADRGARALNHMPITVRSVLRALRVREGSADRG